jgi:gliding motility-associated-like protein
LIADSEEGCTDTFSDSITVIISELEVPNVFTPNGDGTNDFFTVTHKSIQSFSIRIYSRGGSLVYKNEIGDLYEWDGWNGNVLDTNRPASEGVYYYIIEAEGYDDDEYKRGVFRGSVHLFRGEK